MVFLYWTVRSTSLPFYILQIVEHKILSNIFKTPLLPFTRRFSSCIDEFNWLLLKSSLPSSLALHMCCHINVDPGLTDQIALAKVNLSSSLILNHYLYVSPINSKPFIIALGALQLIVNPLLLLLSVRVNRRHSIRIVYYKFLKWFEPSLTVGYF